jgi:hypothetical protein
MRESAEQTPRFTHTKVYVSIWERGSAVARVASMVAGAWSSWLHTSDGWEEDAEQHQETVGATHVCNSFRGDSDLK